MRRLLTARLPRPGATSELPESEASHALNVLRLRDGDRVEAIDGRGSALSCVLRVRGGKALLEAEAGAVTRAASGEETLPLVLELAVLKGDAMEWTIEKAVELGAREVHPLLTDHTVVQ